MGKQRVLAMHGEPDASCLQPPSCTASPLFDISDVRDGGARQEERGPRTVERSGRSTVVEME